MVQRDTHSLGLPNVGAQAFYRSAGYAEAELRRGVARDRLAYPSMLMRRELATAG